ncbi:myb-like protein M isoform X2 [Pieris napi]|uniref:myb-like protein M isoform X2 n=1 Tax=Pieris napi TaxID=78633 RepID=UPI001FB93223|nr:myb-like protein M isoform X2 [Pieris napi]
MNSRETQESSGKSQVPKRTLAKRMSAIIPSSITKWFKNLQSPEQSSSEQSSPDSGCLGEPEPKRRRHSEDPNKYLPRTACASTNTDSLYSARLTQKRKSEDLLNATTIQSPEDAVNRVSFILKSSLRSEDDPKPKETYVDHNRTPGSPFYPGNTTYGGASNHLSQDAIKKRSMFRNRLNKSRGNNDFKMSGSSERIEEVRRISQFVSNENNNNSSTTISNDTSKHIATKSQELQVPSIATILSMKKKSGLMASTSTARQLLASQSSATKYSPYGVYKNSDSAKRLDKSTSNNLTVNIGNLHNMTFTTSTPSTTIAKLSNISQSPNNIEDMQTENSSFQCTNAADAHRNNSVCCGGNGLEKSNESNGKVAEPSQNQNSTNLLLANFDMLSPIVESLNEYSNQNTTSNTQNLSTPQVNDSSNTGTFRPRPMTLVPPSITTVPPSVTSVPECNLNESNLNAFPSESSRKISSTPAFNLGFNQNSIHFGLGPMKSVKFEIGTSKNATFLVNTRDPSGKCESPTIDSHGYINSAADPTNRNIIMTGNNSIRTFGRSNEGSNSLNTDNSSLFPSVQSQPQQQTENSSWASSSNLCSAPQGLPTNQRNQAPTLFPFLGISSDTISMNNVSTFHKNAHMPSPSPAFGMLPANANNSFNLVSTLNQAKSISNINTPGAVPFGKTPQNFTGNSSLFAETSHQMGLQPSFNFSAGQGPAPNVFNFSQSGVRSMTGTSLPQFQVGSSSAPGQARRIRKAVRRTTPR